MALVNEQVTDAVTQTNVKVVAEAPAEAIAMLYQVAAQTAGMGMQNALANQQNMNAINQAATTSAIDRLLHMDPAEALATVKANTGNDVASQLQSLLAALSSGQMSAKTAQTTPPVTVPAPAA